MDTTLIVQPRLVTVSESRNLVRKVVIRSTATCDGGDNNVVLASITRFLCAGASDQARVPNVTSSPIHNFASGSQEASSERRVPIKEHIMAAERWLSRFSGTE